MARFVLGVSGMRKSLAIAVVVFATRASPAHALDVRSELSIGREFVYWSNDIDAELVDGQLGLGAGITLVSDYQVERYGAQALIEYRGALVSAGIAAAFGPRQEGRGWASLDPHAAVHYVVGRWQLDADGGVLLRRLDIERRRASIDVDQLQLHVGGELTLDDRWRLDVLALYSFYDPDPARSMVRDLDLGLVVTLAGKPERWAVGGEVGRRAGRKVWLSTGVAGVVYADGRGRALVPRAAVQLGAWRGISIGASFDLVVAMGDAATDGVREIGGLQLEYER